MKMSSGVHQQTSKECCEAVIRFAPAITSCDAIMRSADPAVRAMRVRCAVLWCACASVVLSWSETQAQDDPTDNETRSFGELKILNNKIN